MSFARACLSQIESMVNESKQQQHQQHQQQPDAQLVECARLIDAEYNLIEATRLIADFDFNIMPVQVRFAENRLDIIKDMLERKETSSAYKDFEKLIELARLMNVSDGADTTKNNDEETNEENNSKPKLPRLRQLIAEHALKKRNLPIANKMCHDLIEMNYAPAWSCVYNLAFSYGRNLIDSHQIVANKSDPVDNVFLTIASHRFDTRYTNKVTFFLHNLEIIIIIYAKIF